MQPPSDRDIFSALHDGTVTSVRGELGSRLTLRIDIEYLASTLQAGTESLLVHLDQCRRADFDSGMGEQVKSLVLGTGDCDLTILSAEQNPDEESEVLVHCAEGRMLLDYRAISFETESGIPFTVHELARASRLYWLRWEARGRAAKIGLTLRQVSAEEMPALRTLYTQHLEHLARFNPNVDTTQLIQDDWTRKPGVLFAYFFWLGDDPEPAGFALFGGAKLSAAIGSSTDFVMWEFFVAERQRRRGIGSMAVNELLDRYRGRWSLAVLPNNGLATGFWTACLRPYGLDVVDWTDDEGVLYLRHLVSSESLENPSGPTRMGR